MADYALTEILESLARQRSGAAGPDMPGQQSPLLLTYTLDARSGERISHLPISQRLSHAWVTLTGAPFRPHQALALSALRRGEPFALTGDQAAARQTLHLLIYEALRATAHTRALLLLPTDDLADVHVAELRRLAGAVAEPLTIAHVDAGTSAREAVQARIILTTPDILHRRLLRYHDRAWQALWANLDFIMLADADQYSGVAAAQLGGLLLRSMRLVLSEEPPLLIATLAMVQGAEATLFSLSGVQWRLIQVDDTPHPVTTLAVWQSGHDYLHDAVYMAQLFVRLGNRVHILCQEPETAVLASHLDADGEQMSVGGVPRPAQVHILAGYPGSHAAVWQSLTSGAHFTVLLLGNMPLERTLARMPDSLINDPPPLWLPAPLNAYVAAQHLLCAAAERPISLDEVAAWQAEDMIARLERHDQIVRLPDEQTAWQPLPSAGDPYDGFGMRAVGSSPIAMYADDMTLLDTLDPAAFDRWAFPGAALPPVRGGYRVVERDDEMGSIVVQTERQLRRTLPLRHCTVNMRQHDERESRTLRGRLIGWGRVLIEEEVYGYRETQPGASPVEQTLTPPLSTRWTAPALWIDLPLRLRSSGQLIGWSVVAALPWRVLCRLTDLVPAYDAGLRRLYLIDAQPGGNGLAVWLYANLEKVLPLAYDIALDGHNDALLEPVARMDMDWLLTLLSERRVGDGRKQKPDDDGDGGKPTVESGVPAGERASRQRPAEQSVREKQRAGHQHAAERATVEDVAQDAAKVAAFDGGGVGQVAAPPKQTPVVAETPRAGKGKRQAAPPPEQTPVGAETPRAGKGKRSRRGKPARAEQAQSTSGDEGPGYPAPDEQGPGYPTPNAPSDSSPGYPAPGGESPDYPAAPDEQGPSHPAPNADSILARLRQMLGKAKVAHAANQVIAGAMDGTSARQEPRFQAGERIICLPYGEGVVQASTMHDNEEVLQVEFPEYGVLAINPSVSMVRRSTPDSTRERQMGEEQ